jgi:hypothetical protein
MLRNSVIVASAAILLSAGAAAAQSRVEVGVLSCRGDTTTYIVASRKEMNCVFRRTDGATSRYHAKVVVVGVDVGVYQAAAIDWGVLAPTRNVGPGDLRGNYGGLSAGGSIGLGIGANVLLGGSNNSFALQPLSAEGKAGWGIWAGIAGLELTADDSRPRRRSRRR